MQSQHPLWKSLSLIGFVFVAACESDGTGDKIDPSHASPEHLEGYWVASDSTQPDQLTVLGFASAENADYELPLAENQLSSNGQPAGVVYRTSRYSSDPFIQQITSYDVSGGALLQTVLADVNAPPGMQYSTEIYELTHRTSMVLESSNDPSGRRTYQWFERCPGTIETGWYAHRGMPCPTYTSGGTSLAFDAYGDVHAISGMGAADLQCQSPTFTDITRGCGSRMSVAPNLTVSAMSIADDDVIRIAYVDGSFGLHMRERPVRGDTWTDTVIDATPGTNRKVFLFQKGSRRVVALGTFEQPLVLYEWNGTSYQKQVAQIAVGANQYLNAAAIGEDGKLVVAMEGPTDVALWRETNAGFTAVATPPETEHRGGIASVYVDPSGRIHAVFVGRDVGDSPGGVGGMVLARLGSYAVLEGTQWTEHDLGLFYGAWIATHGNGPLRVVIATDKAARPALALVTIEDGVMRAEYMNNEETFGSFGSVPTWVQTAVAVGKDGSIASSFNGEMIYVRRPDRDERAKPATVQLTFSGMGSSRVKSMDGRVDCTDDCTFESFIGERLELYVENAEGTRAYLPCFHQALLAWDHCPIAVRMDPFTINVNQLRTAIQRVTLPGSSRGSSTATNFGLHGPRAAFVAAMNAGVFHMQGEELSTGNTSATWGIVQYDRESGTSWICEAPLEAKAVAPADDGGAFAVFDVSGTTMIDGMTIGSSAMSSVVRVRFDATGNVTGATTIAATPYPSLRAVTVQHDGTVTAVVSATEALSSLGSTAKTVLVYVAPTGTPSVLTLSDTYQGSAIVASHGTRSVAAFGDATTTLVTANAGVLAGMRSIAGSLQARALDVDDTRIAVLLLPGSGADPVNLGGGSRTAGTSFVAEYDTALGYVGDAALTAGGSLLSVGLVEGGTIVVDGTSARRYAAGVVMQSMIGLNFTNAVQHIASGSDEDSAALLVLATGTPDLDNVAHVGDVPRSLLIELSPPAQ